MITSVNEPKVLFSKSYKGLQMRLSYVNIIFVRAGMSELADEADSKSVDGNIVWVQVPLPAYKRPQVSNRKSEVFLFAAHRFLKQKEDASRFPRDLRPLLFYLYILTLLFCDPDIIKTVKCCKVIFRCLCTTDHLHTSVFFEQ